MAVIGHRGWAEKDESAAKYALAISFEMMDGDLEIYEMIRAEVETLQTQTPTKVPIRLSAAP